MKFRYPTLPVPEPVPGNQPMRNSGKHSSCRDGPPSAPSPPVYTGRTKKALRLRTSGRVGFQTGISRAVLNSINRSLLPRPRRTRPRQNPAGQGSPSVPMSKINIRKQKQTEYSANLRFLSTKDPERTFRPLRRAPCLPLPPERKARDRENTALRRTKTRCNAGK